MDTIFFIIAKLIGALIRFETWLVIVLAFSLIALVAQNWRITFYILVCTFFSIVGLSISPIGSSSLARIEATYLANPTLNRVDGAMVLGGGGDLSVSKRWEQLE